MAGKVRQPSKHPLDPSCRSILILITFVYLFILQTTKRKGWINHSIKGPESIADHMYRMALMALIAGDLPSVDRERCVSSSDCFLFIRFPLSFVSFLCFVLTTTILFFLKTGASKLLLCMTLLKVGPVHHSLYKLLLCCLFNAII